ncbi:MAG: terminase family protein [Bacteroidales bacterium]|nr:terminase family protein [Bacteroidales bacterium]
MGNTRGTLERNILEPMRNIWPGMVGNIRSDNTVSMFGRKVYALGADNKKHVQRIQGATFEYVYGDEVTTWAQDVFEMLKSRLRCEHSHFDGTCNPDNPQHWFKQFIDSDADVYCQQYRIDDGVLPARIVEELKKEYAGTMYYDRFILGRWTQAEGLVYPMFCDENIADGHGTDGEWYLSMDYGTMNPTAMGLWRISGGTATMEREYYYDGRKERKQKTDEEYYSDLVAFVGDAPIKRVIIDPSAASMKACIHKHGKFYTLDADNRVLDGIRLVGTLIAQRKVMIHRDCRNTLNELRLYRWDETKQEDAVIKEFDHSCDQMRYLCQTLRRKFRDGREAQMYGRAI